MSPGLRRLLLVAVVLSALVALWASAAEPPRAALIYLFKPLTTVLILAWALAIASERDRYLWAIAAGLACSLVGDVFLMLPGDYFLAGLGAFLVAHLCYLVAFTTGVRFAASRLAFAVWLLVAAGGLAFVWNHAQPQLAILVYGLVLGSMAAQATVRALTLRTRPALWAALGAAVFVLSDTLLAIDRFRAPLPVAPLLILATYYLAQGLIAGSVAGASSPAGRPR
ncbi:MAG TPA: lysoplasmalogenase [Thermoanaerobaculia bacterium]|nr:lysoplasmalogenase [Thermoanaerobaculia bacterium]